MNSITVRWTTPVPGSGYEVEVKGRWVPFPLEALEGWQADGGMVRWNPGEGGR